MWKAAGPAAGRPAPLLHLGAGQKVGQGEPSHTDGGYRKIGDGKTGGQILRSDRTRATLPIVGQPKISGGCCKKGGGRTVCGKLLGHSGSTSAFQDRGNAIGTTRMGANWFPAAIQASRITHQN
jgi:hypothetical protein